MTHYTMMQTPVPRTYQNEFMAACYVNLTNFNTSFTLLGGEGIHSLQDIGGVVDLSSDSIKTIGITINPYKRMVLNYFMIMDPETNRTLYNEYDYSNCKTFPEFVKEFLDPANPSYLLGNSNNVASYYKPTNGPSVDYLLEFDTFETDIRSIPEFANSTNLDCFQKARQALTGFESLYDEESKQMVATVFAEDIAYWNYTFG